MNVLSRLAVLWKLRRCSAVGAGVRVRGRVAVRGGGAVHVGAGVTLDGRRAPIELHSFPGAEIVLEDGVRIDAGASIEACGAVRIGARSRVDEFCKIMDNHFHKLTGDRASSPAPVPVQVGPDTRIGAHAVLLPGARIGREVTIGPRTVVSRPVPDGARIEGQPARTRPR